MMKMRSRPESPKADQSIQSWQQRAAEKDLVPGSPKSVASKDNSFQGKSQEIGGRRLQDVMFSLPPELSVSQRSKLLKAEFVKSQLLHQKQSKNERIRNMSDEEFLRSEFYEAKIKSIREEPEETYPNELKATDPVILTGAHTYVKKGFCGSTVKSDYVEIKITKENEISIAQSQIYGGAQKIPQAELDKLKNLLPKELLNPENFAARRVEKVAEELNLSKVATSGKPEDKLKSLYPPPNSKFDLVVQGPIGKDGKLDLFIKDSAQYEYSRNLLLNNQLYSSQYLSQFGPSRKIDPAVVVAIWKGRLAERFLEQVESVRIKRDTNYAKTVFLLQRARNAIRLGTMKSVLLKLKRNEDQVIVTQRLGALRNIYMLQELAENSERMRTALNMLRRFAKQDRRPPQVTTYTPAQINHMPMAANLTAPEIGENMELKLRPVKLFLSPYTKPNVNSPVKDLLERLTNPDFQTIDELEILISDTDLTAEEINMHYKTERMYKVERIPIPPGTDMPAREFDLLMRQQHINLTDCYEKYLVVYLTNLDDRRVWAHGSVRIFRGFGEKKAVQLVDSRGSKVGTIVLKNVDLAVPPQMDNRLVKYQVKFLHELLNPARFGNLRKLQQAKSNDRGYSRISNMCTIRSEYEQIKQNILQKLYRGADMVEFEESNFRVQEWAEFEKFFNESAEYAREVNRKHGNQGRELPFFSEHDPRTLGLTNQTGAPTRQHSLRRGVSEYQPRQPVDQFVLDRDEFRARAESQGIRISAQLDFDQTLYMYNCIIPWELTLKNTGHLDVLERALTIGVPSKDLLRVWKSVGKSPLAVVMVQDICSEILPNFESNKPILSQIANLNQSRHKLSSSILQSIDEISDLSTPEEQSILHKVLKAYTNLGWIMSQANSKIVAGELPRKGLVGFTLIPANISTISLIRHLIRVSALTNNKQAVSMRDAIETDVFCALISLVFVVLPEHFLYPEPTIQAYWVNKGEQETNEQLRSRIAFIESYIQKFDQMGTSLKKLLSKKAVGLVLTGTQKVATLFAQLVFKELPNVYHAMAELGFPFTTFAADVVDSLFTNHLNLDTLNKLWSVLFFEGASSHKRRAQQVMLSALVAIIHQVKRAIVESKSIDEIKWYLKAAAFDVQSSEFIHRVFTIQRKHFKTNESNISVISEIEKLIKGNKSMEDCWAEIEGKLIQKVLPVRRSVTAYQDQIKDLMIRAETDGQNVDFLHLGQVCESLVFQPSLKSGEYKLTFNNNFEKIVLGELGKKAEGEEVLIGLSSWDFGDFIPRGSSVTIESSLHRHPITLEVTNRNWYMPHVLQGTKSLPLEKGQILITLKLQNCNGILIESPHSINMANFTSNQDNFFQIEHGNLTLIFYIKVCTSENLIPNTAYYDTLVFDPQHRQTLFGDSLANHLKLPKISVYESELTQNQVTDQKFVENFMQYCFRTREPQLSDAFKKNLSENLLQTMKPNFFELFVHVLALTFRNEENLYWNLFDLLNKIDQTYQAGKVKLSHVGFLMWYLARLAGIMQPLHEINSQISSILNPDEPQILSAMITPLDDLKQPRLDITELLNIWMAAERKRTGRHLVILGQKGYLNTLREAVLFWQQETGVQPHEFSAENKLRVITKSASGRVASYEYFFDKQMRLIFEFKNLDIALENKYVDLQPGNDQPRQRAFSTQHVILLQDTETSVDYEMFIKIVTSLSITNRILSRLGLSYIHDFTKLKGLQEHLSKLDRTESRPLQLEIGFCEAGTTTKFASVLLTTDEKAQSSFLSESEEKQRLEQYVEKQQSFSHSKSAVRDITGRLITDEVTLLAAIHRAAKLCGQYYLSQLQFDTLQSPFAAQNFELLDQPIQVSRIKRGEDVLKVTQRYTSLRELRAKLQQSQTDSKIILLVEVQLKGQESRIYYNHFGKNVYDFEGVSVVDNPLSSCKILKNEGLISSVKFFGSQDKISLIPSDQLI